jgi:hypothetical protein
MRQVKTWVAAVACAALAGGFGAGCSSGSKSDAGNSDSGLGDAGADSGTDAGGACAAYAAADCAYVNACEPGTFQATYGTQATCQANLTTSCLNNVDAPGGAMNATWLSTCPAQLVTQTAACASGPVPLALPSLTDGCALVGAGAAGAGCGIDAQCAADDCNRVGVLCGTCATAGTLGQACGPGTGVACQRGLTCSLKNVCASLVGVSTACDLGVTTECIAGATCVVSDADAGTGQCQANGVTVGAACDPTGIGAPRCSDIAGFVCNASTNLCQAIIYADAGAPCGLSDGGAASPEVDCWDGLCANGLCAARGTVSGGCTVGAPPGCIESQVCVADTAGLAGTCTQSTPSCYGQDAGYPNFTFAPTNISLSTAPSMPSCKKMGRPWTWWS